MKNFIAKKALGQHWLNDLASLQAMCEAAEVGQADTVLEIGPGHGSLTKLLVKRAKQVVAVEKDKLLVKNLTHQALADNLKIVEGDILKFDLDSLPAGYKIVANIPYYLSGSLFRLLTETANPPAKAALLVQKEVAGRVYSQPGQMSVLAVSVKLVYEPSLGRVVSAGLFQPPPKVDSQILILTHRPQPLFGNLDQVKFLRLVKAGFAGRRKKLRSSLSASLQISKEQADRLLTQAGISSDLRAQNLSLADWHSLYKNF